MRKGAAFVFLLALGACQGAARLEGDASTRVETMFSMLKEGSSHSEGIALCWWLEGKGNCEQTDGRSTAFDEWRRARGIYKLESYSVSGAVREASGSVTVKAKANGKDLTILAAPGEPLRWGG